MLLSIVPGKMGGKFTAQLFLAMQDIGIQKKKKTRNSRMNGWIDGGGDSVN
jgi:hypothetical protein